LNLRSLLEQSGGDFREGRDAGNIDGLQTSNSKTRPTRGLHGRAMRPAATLAFTRGTPLMRGNLSNENHRDHLSL
jgi:hypothetical protein